jgi:UDP-N-acetylglucosamine 2-epimerase (non-hydrolysing)
MKVATILGTRPEVIRLSRVIPALDRYFDHVLIHTGQNHEYELNQLLFDDLGLRSPDHFLHANGENAAATIGLIIAKSYSVLREIEPDAVLILGDTNSALSAIAAKRLKIPVFHMEAGNRCFDERVPEEMNRRIVDHSSDVNMPYSDIAREYLLREGIAPDRIVKTGSPMHEVLTHYRARIDQSLVLEKLGVSAGEYFVVSAHREENIEPDHQFVQFVELLKQLSITFSLPVVVSVHPRTRNKIAERLPALPATVKLTRPLCFTDYVQLMIHARATLSDSGTISEEASILNLKAVNIREACERPEAMEEGAVMMTGLDSTRVLDALRIMANQPDAETRTHHIVRDYDTGHVSEKVARIILSYTHVVNRNVWHKQVAANATVASQKFVR